MFGHRGLHYFRFAKRHGAQHHPGRAAGQREQHALLITNAATELNQHAGLFEHLGKLGVIALRVAKRAVAAEIMPNLVEHYRAKGFDFRHVDATSDVDLGDRFDRIFIGDVIEHVNDPIALLRFAKRHLKPDGRVLVTTPNPFAPRFRLHRRQRGTRYVMANLEHTRWVSISNMHELAWRAGMDMVKLRWPLLRKPKPGKFAYNAAMLGRKTLVALAPLEDVFVEYAFELAHATAAG